MRLHAKSIWFGQGSISGWVRYRSKRPEGSLDPSLSLRYLSVPVNGITRVLQVAVLHANGAMTRVLISRDRPH